MNSEIKSQDDLNAQGRETDVLIATIMKCQEIVKEKVKLENENKRLKGWLEFIATMQWGELKDCKNYARQALDGSEVLQ